MTENIKNEQNLSSDDDIQQGKSQRQREQQSNNEEAINQLPPQMRENAAFTYWMVGVFSLMSILFIGFICFIAFLLQSGENAPPSNGAESRLLVPEFYEELSGYLKHNQKQVRRQINTWQIDKNLDRYNEPFALQLVFKFPTAYDKQMPKLQQQQKLSPNDHPLSNNLSICIIKSSKSDQQELDGAAVQIFLESVSGLEYWKYQMVWVCGQLECVQIRKYMGKDDRLRDRVVLVEDTGNRMRNKIAVIEHCGESQIILEIKQNGVFINSQFLNVLNQLYSREPSIWLLYARMISSKNEFLSKNTQNKFHHSQFSKQKLSQYPNTKLYFETYRKLLFSKINLQQLIDSNDEQNNQQFDNRVTHALIQLSKDAHIKFYDIPPSIYFQENSNHRYEAE